MGNTRPNPKDRRGSDREQLAALMPVSLVIKGPGGERTVSGCLYDVSAEGLSLILREEVGEGHSAVLMTIDERIGFVVTWVTKDGDRAYRCGLRLVGEHGDLRHLFSAHVARRATS